jgi:hypothetical protein
MSYKYRTWTTQLHIGQVCLRCALPRAGEIVPQAAEASSPEAIAAAIPASACLSSRHAYLTEVIQSVRLLCRLRLFIIIRDSH